LFSGIVSGLGSIKSIKDKHDILSIEIKAPKNFSKKLKKGASVSVDGVCLTAKNSNSDIIKFDVIEETLSRSTLGNLVKGQKVNLERSITSSSEINIHLIPETLKVTNLGTLEKKDKINIELDQNTVTIVDTVERVLNR